MNIDTEILECKKRLTKLYAMISDERKTLKMLKIKKRNDEFEKELLDNIESCNECFGIETYNGIISDFSSLKIKTEIEESY